MWITFWIVHIQFRFITSWMTYIQVRENFGLAGILQRSCTFKNHALLEILHFFRATCWKGNVERPRLFGRRMKTRKCHIRGCRKICLFCLSNKMYIARPKIAHCTFRILFHLVFVKAFSLKITCFLGQNDREKLAPWFSTSHFF